MCLIGSEESSPARSLKDFAIIFFYYPMLADKTWSISCSLLGSIYSSIVFLLDQIATESEVIYWSEMFVSTSSANSVEMETWRGGTCGQIRDTKGVLAPFLPLTD